MLLGGAAAAWPLAARAQQIKQMRRVGALIGGAESDPEFQARLAAFRQNLEKLGWSEGKNIRIDYRFTAASREQTEIFAKELVALQPEVIFASSTLPAAALQRESRMIPIVFGIVCDPIALGFVASLPRPGGNLTGFTSLESSISGKWLGMLKEIAPHVSRAASSPTRGRFLTITCCERLGLWRRRSELTLFQFGLRPPLTSSERFESFALERNGGLVVPADATMAVHRDVIFVTCGAAPVAGSVWRARHGRGRRSLVLQHRLGRAISAVSVICGPYPARRKAC